MNSTLQVAAKVIDLSLHRKLFEQEVKVMRRIGHLVGYLGADTRNGKGEIFMELLPSITLFDQVKEFGYFCQADALDVTQQLLCATAHLASKGISHHDLKPENISFNRLSKSIKIFDFGLACEVADGGTVEHYCGSPLYLAPEVLMTTPHCPIKADMWSIGTIFYYVLHGDSPFHKCKSLSQLRRTVVANQVAFAEDLSFAVVQLLRGLLDPQATHRTSIQLAMETLQVIKSSISTNEMAI